MINLKGMVRGEGKCSYCTNGNFFCSFLKPKQRTDIFSVPTLNSIQYFSRFQLQFTNCHLIGVKPGEVLQVPHKSLGKSMLFAVKHGLISMCHIIAMLLYKDAVFLCCGWFLNLRLVHALGKTGFVLYHCII